MEIGWDMDAERDLWRAITAPTSWHGPDGTTPYTHPKSLIYFCKHVWGVEHYLDAHPETPRWYYEPIHNKFLDWLQKHLLEWRAASRAGRTAELKQLAVILPRGFGKTVLASKAAQLWLHVGEPDLSTLFLSATEGLSEDILKAIQAVMSGEDKASWFTWLFGNWRYGAKVWSRNNVIHPYRKAVNLSEPSFDVASIDTGATGYHHRVWVIDDPLTANKLREGKEAHLRNAQTATNACYNAIQSNGLMMMVLTRYLDGDVAGRQLRDGGVRSWDGMPCVMNNVSEKVKWGRGTWDVFFWQTEEEYSGEPTHPILWTREKIAAHKRRDPEDFACQQQNNPGSIELAPLTEQVCAHYFLDYRDAEFAVSFEDATLHIDTAFKTTNTIRSGDYSVIVPYLHDARRNGIIYLDTDLLMASNEMTEEQFNQTLIKTCINLRRRSIRVRAITDEKEPGGKVGTYKNRIVALMRAAGFSGFQLNQFQQFGRTVNKKARIRTGAGHIAEGYVRFLLHKDDKGEFIVPPVLRELIRQFCRIDVVDHDDLADAATDGFTEGIWRRPISITGSDPQNSVIHNPGDDILKSFGKRMTDAELLEFLDRDKDDGVIYSPLSPYSEKQHLMPWDDL